MSEEKDWGLGIRVWGKKCDHATRQNGAELVAQGDVMSHYAIDVPECLCDLAYEVAVENVKAIVDDILDENGTSTIVIESELDKSAIENILHEYLHKEAVSVYEVV
ncbi:MAG: hypothetical protein SVV80_00840 [Planctomycetota bacterium]|nr:hypothetical protein [Planctomycetota bacterium]